MKKTNYSAFILLATAVFLYAVSSAAAQSPVKTPTAKSNAEDASNEKPTDEVFLAAARDDEWDLVKEMILRGANVNAVSPKDGGNALHNVASCSCEKEADRVRVIEIINLLAKSNIDFNLPDKEGYTPLMMAVRYGDINNDAIIKALLAAGADVNFTNRFGENAAYLIKTKNAAYTVKVTERKDAAAKLILSRSAPSSGVIAEKFSDEDFSNALDDQYWDRVKRMVALGANVNVILKDDDQSPALVDVAHHNNFEVVKLLVEKGADVKAADKSGTTPLHRAIMPINEKPDLEMVKYLLAKGADPNALSRHLGDNRPLSQAITNSKGDFTIVKLLLDYGADPNIPVGESRNALDYSIFYENPEAVEFFKPLVKDTLAERRKKLPGKFVQVAPDIDIYYEIFGADKSGTPLVVLHGGPGFDHKYFLTNSTFTELAKNRPVIFYDQRGTGFSSPMTFNQETSVNNQVEDLTSLVNHLGYKKFDLMGHSWGGFLSILYATQFSERLSHLIICDTMAPDFSDFDKYSVFEEKYPELFELSRQKRSKAFWENDSVAAREGLVAYMKMLFYSPERRDAFIASSGNFTYSYQINSQLSKDARENFFLEESLPKITAPTLIIHGKHDYNIIPQLAKNIHAKIPKSQLVIFDKSGHLPFYEEPEKFITTVEKFLGGK